MESLVAVFDAALSEKLETRQAAENEILKMFNTDVVTLLSLCASIILSDSGASERSVQYALIVIVRALEPTHMNPLPRIQHHWETCLSQEQRNTLQMAVIRGLMFPVQKICGVAAHCVALVVRLERKRTIDVFSHLAELVMSSKYTLATHFAALAAIKEIYSCGCAGDMLPDAVGVMRGHLEMFYQIIGAAVQYPVPFVKDVVVTLAELVKSQAGRFRSMEEQQRLFCAVVELLPKVTDVEMYEAVHYLLLSDVQVFYGDSQFPLDKVMDIVVNGIKCANPTFSAVSLAFWEKVARVEIDFVKENEMADRYENAMRAHMTGRQIAQNQKLAEVPHSPWTRRPVGNYIQCFASRHIGVVLDVLVRVDPNNTGVDDRDDAEPYMFAHSLLRKMFFLAPEIVFESVKARWDPNIGSGLWIIQHGMLVAINTLCCRDRQFPLVKEFLNMCGDFIVTCTASGIDRVADTALWTLRNAIECYGLFVTPEKLLALVEHVTKLIRRGDSIAQRSFDALTAIVRRFDAHVLDSPLIDQSFSSYVCNIYQSTVEYCNNWEKHEILDKLYLFLQEYLCRLPNSGLELVNQFIDKLVHGLAALKQQLTSAADPQLLIYDQQCRLSTLNGVFETYASKVSERALGTVRILIEIIRDEEGPVLADALSTLTRIVSALGMDTADILEPIMQAAHKAIQSGVPTLVSTAASLVGNLFINATTGMLPFLDQ